MSNYVLELKLDLKLICHRFLNLFSSCICRRCKQKFIDNTQDIICKNCLENSLLTENTGLKISDNGIKIYFSSLYQESLIEEVLLENALDIEEQLKFNREQMLDFKYKKPELCFLFSKYLESFYRNVFIASGNEKEDDKNAELEVQEQWQNCSLIICCVPCFPDRKYNQAFLLAKYFYKFLKTATPLRFKQNIKFIPELFYRVKNTKKLHDKSASERKRELEDAFRINENAESENAEIEVRGQSYKGTACKRTSSRLRRTNNRSVLQVHEDYEDDENAEIEVRGQCKKILIVDDIVTTGTTINELGKILINKGVRAKNIIGLTALGRNYH
jgi:predicted amidophosphoribosyltransferase